MNHQIGERKLRRTLLKFSIKRSKKRESEKFPFIHTCNCFGYSFFSFSSIFSLFLCLIPPKHTIHLLRSVIIGKNTRTKGKNNNNNNSSNNNNNNEHESFLNERNVPAFVCVCVCERENVSSKVVRARVQVWAQEMNDTVCKKQNTKKLISEENEQKNWLLYIRTRTMKREWVNEDDGK